MKAKKLILFTNGFPCVKEGEEFLEKELELLSVEFESILIYVLTKADICRKLPANVEVKCLEVVPGKKVRSVVSNYFLTIIKIILNDLKDSATRKTISNNFKFYFNVLIGNILLKESFEKEISSMIGNEAKLYSYWCGPWFDVLMLLDKKITDRITFRAHGYDFDVNQRPNKCIPYRNYLMKKNPFISFISQFGYNTYGSQYPSYTKKKMYRLGVVSQNENPITGLESEKVIVSCSSLIELKRVNLIAEILKNTASKIKWVHFGDGPLLPSIKENVKSLGTNVSVEFKGYVSHDSILKYYKENHIDLFMNVSELEGIPVSIMEAISFGIPVTGCNICGVPEIVTKETGFLWDVNFKPMNAAKEIEDYLQSPENRKQDLRKSTKNYWEKHFDADKNYKSFIKDCLLN